MSRGEMDEQVRAYWTPGRSHGLVWSQGVALVEASMPIEAAVELWERCQQGVSMGEFLEALSTCSGAGLLTLPSFVVVLDAGTATHIAARGNLSVSAFINDKPEDISGGQVTTWVERQLAGVDGFVLRDESGPQADQTARPLVGGLVAAAELRRGINGKTPNANPLVECVPAAGEFVDHGVDFQHGRGIGCGQPDREHFLTDAQRAFVRSNGQVLHVAHVRKVPPAHERGKLAVGKPGVEAVGGLAKEIPAIGARRIAREHHLRDEIAPAARAAEDLQRAGFIAFLRQDMFSFL